MDLMTLLCSVLVAICDDMCKTIIATALLLSFIVSILLSSYFIHRYHKNSPKAPIASAEMTFRRPVQSYPISFPGNNVRRSSQESIETDTFKIPVSDGAGLMSFFLKTLTMGLSVLNHTFTIWHHYFTQIFAPQINTLSQLYRSTLPQS